MNVVHLASHCLLSSSLLPEQAPAAIACGVVSPALAPGAPFHLNTMQIRLADIDTTSLRQLRAVLERVTMLHSLAAPRALVVAATEPRNGLPSYSGVKPK